MSSTAAPNNCITVTILPQLGQLREMRCPASVYVCLVSHCSVLHRDELHRSQSDTECGDVDETHHDRLPAQGTHDGPETPQRASIV